MSLKHLFSKLEAKRIQNTKKEISRDIIPIYQPASTRKICKKIFFSSLYSVNTQSVYDFSGPNIGDISKGVANTLYSPAKQIYKKKFTLSHSPCMYTVSKNLDIYFTPKTKK